MKTLWTDAYLSDLAIEAEIQISLLVPCIYVRFPLNITLGQGIYDFENTAHTPVAQRLTGIIRITWQGWTVHPQFGQILRNIVVPLKPWDGDIQSSRPFIYMRQGFGMNAIKFYPAPNANIPYDNTNINTQTGIANNVIVSGWRIADPTGATYRLPDYVRELLVRYYVLSRAYKKEGKGQNLDASKYYDFKFNSVMDRFKTINSQLYASRVKAQTSPAPDIYGSRPPRPTLPPNFGPIVQ